MYFLTALGATIVAGVLWIFFRDRKGLHLDVLTIIFGAATLMWLMDVIFTAASGEAPLGFEALDGQIALYTLLGGVFLWVIVSFVLNNRNKSVKA